MSWYDYIIIYLFSIVTILISIMSYGKLIDNKLVVNLKLFLVLILSSLCVTLNIYFVSGASRAYISFLIILIDNYFVYGDDIDTVFINTMVCYLMELVIEIVISISLLPTGIISLKSFDENILLKVVFSMITMFIPYIILSIKKIKNFLKKIINTLNKPFLTMIIMLLALFFLCILSYKFVRNFSEKAYVDNVLLLLFFVILISIII